MATPAPAINKLTLVIQDSEPHARVTQTLANGTEKLSRILLQDLPKLITDSTSGTIVASDTGYQSPYLVREQTTNSQTRRLYLYPEIKATLHIGSSREPLEGNSYGFSSTSDSRGDDLLVMPGYTFKNFAVFLNNTNNEEFSNVSHNFGCLSTDMFNQVSDESRLYFVGLNHFDSSVCWHRDFDHSLLKSRNTVRQATIAYSYLNSFFNTDLDIRLRLNSDVVDKHVPELRQYLNEVFGYNESQADRLISNAKGSEYYDIIIIMYYLNTVLGYRIETIIRPDLLTSTYVSNQLSDLFKHV